jgi:hypothetical protein
LEYDGKRVYALVQDIGLTVFFEKEAELVKTPSHKVASIAAIGEKLYVAFNEGAIYIRFPDRTLTEIASCRSVAERNSFDGGKPYKINAMLGDPERSRMWLNCMDSNRKGLWYHDLKENKFERVTHPSGHITWHRGSILRKFGGRHRWNSLLDPDTGKIVHLFGAPEKPGAPYGKIYEFEAGPGCVIGEHLILAGRARGPGGSTVSGSVTHHWKGKGGLFLHTNKGEPAWLGTSPEGQPLHVDYVLDLSENSFLIGDRSGKFRMVSRKMAAGE